MFLFCASVVLAEGAVVIYRKFYIFFLQIWYLQGGGLTSRACPLVALELEGLDFVLACARTACFRY